MKSIVGKKAEKTKLKVNDNVIVITGVDKGRRGKILHIDRGKSRIIIENVNKKHKHIKPSQEFPKGGKVHIERWLNVSNVMLFCDKCKKGVRIGMKLTDNAKSRVCKKCGKSI